MTTKWHRPLAITLWVTVACVIAQAALAGEGLFGSPSVFELHGWIGSAVVVLAAVAVALSWLARERWPVRIGTLALAAATVSQIGMGYAGRRGGNPTLSALHVPLGVALLGLAVALAVLVSARRGADAAAASEPGSTAS